MTVDAEHVPCFALLTVPYLSAFPSRRLSVLSLPPLFLLCPCLSSLRQLVMIDVSPFPLLPVQLFVLLVILRAAW